MFTGIVESMGRVRLFRTSHGKTWLEVEAPEIFKDLKIGSSVAVNGVCLTAAVKKGKNISFNLVRETKKRTSFGSLRAGDRVNLERAMKWNGRIEGHFVLGHVDGTGRIRKITGKGKEKNFLISFPKNLRRFILEKGSVAVDGVSLTIGKVLADAFWAHLIPHTLKSTTFGGLSAGSRVNLEADILMKFFRRSR